MFWIRQSISPGKRGKSWRVVPWKRQLRCGPHGGQIFWI
jgi:hypothetical protein